MAKKKKTLIGYKYLLGIHLVVIKAVDAILVVYGNGLPMITTPITGNTSVAVNLPDLYGGDTKEGGVVGQFDFEFGGPTQGRNDYLVAKQGGGDPNKVPAYRGVLGVVIRHAYLAALSPSLKAISFLARNCDENNNSWYPAKSNMGGDCNPVHVGIAALTSTQFGLGLPLSKINQASALAAADTVFAEGYAGMSFKWAGNGNVQDLLKDVCRYMSGAIYEDPTTGVFAFKLFRNDYDASTLTLFDESNITSLETYQIPSPSDTVNEIVVSYTIRGTKNTDSVTWQDGASIQSQGNVNSQAEDFLACGTAANASLHAARRGRDLSLPLHKVKFKCKRIGYSVRIGDCIKFSWTKHSVSQMILRVVDIDYGTLESGEITIDSVEDVFGQPFATYTNPVQTGWTNPVSAPAALTDRFAGEATYFEIRRALSDPDAAAMPFGVAYLTETAATPAQVAQGFDLWSKDHSASTYIDADTSDFAAVAVVGAASKTSTSVSVTTSVGNIAGVELGTYASWDGELVRFDAYTAGVLTIGRGVLDTVPIAHSAGSKIYFNEDAKAVDTTQYTIGETVDAKALMTTGFGSYALASQPVDSITFVGRYDKPYPPANVKINGADWPSSVTDALSITWAHRDRTQELAGLIDQTAASIGPEAGTTYNVRAYDNTSNALLLESLAIVGTSAAIGLPTGTYSARVEIESVRDGLTSYQKHVHVFAFNRTATGRILESGAARNLESGSQRMLE